MDNDSTPTAHHRFLGGALAIAAAALVLLPATAAAACPRPESGPKAQAATAKPTKPASAPGRTATPSTTSTTTPSSSGSGTVQLAGGHVTDPRDHGRPVVLVASMLGVSADVFRDAFSRVSPAPAGSEPEGAQVQLNKAALLATLSPYGVTNDWLDQVSNHYRYVASSGQLWTNRAAVLRAVVRDGVLTGVEIVDGGAGYTSAPTLTVAGFPNAKLTATVGFTHDFATNGQITKVTVAA